MHPAIQESIQEFEEREGARITQVPNGCGILVAQIRSGQHPDAYFACDTTFMTQVKDIFPVSYDLSGTEMVLVTTRKRSMTNVTKLNDLTIEGLKVGLCDPEHSALGDLSKRLLTSASIWDAVQKNVLDWPSTADRLVEGVVLGALDAAIVYRANTTRQKDQLNIFDVNSDLAKAIQPIAVANDSPYPLLTGRLIAKLRSADSKRRFEALGFRWVSSDQ
jgi:molybdenum ABC transporter molybdate-binding protein